MTAEQTGRTSATTSATAEEDRGTARHPLTSLASRVRLPTAGGAELLLVAVLYAAYSVTRTFANSALAPAEAHAEDILGIEHALHLAWETAVNTFYGHHSTWSLISDYWYCTAHYLLTPAVLIWLYRRGPATYRPMRRALVLATILALALYLLVPTAPPRFLHGYVDVLATHQHQGWWGSDASAPKGMGWLTNQLAAFPSMHAGYALWVAIALHLHARHRLVRIVGWATALMTAVTVIGTANHWVLDVVAGWAIVIAAVLLTRDRGGAKEPDQPQGSPVMPQ